MVHHLPPIFAMGSRCILGGIFLIGFAKLPSKKEFKVILKISLNMFTLNFLFFSIGIKTTSSNVAALITQIDVPFTIILSIFFLNEKFRFRYFIGFLIGIVGLNLILINDYKSLQFTSLSILSLIFSSFFYSISVIQLKKTSLDLLKLNSWGLILSGVTLFILSLLIEQKMISYEIVNINLLFSLLLAITSTCVFILWSYLIKHLNITKLSSFLLLIPLFSLIFNAMILHEIITFRLILGILVTLLGVSIFHTQNYSKKISLVYSLLKK